MLLEEKLREQIYSAVMALPKKSGKENLRPVLSGDERK